MESLSLTAKALRLRRLDDESVASRTLSGDPAAFVELHRRFRKRVEGACARRLDGQNVEDAAQETFIRVLRAAPQQIENVEAWLLTIARNVCIDISRKASRVETPAEDSVFQEALPAADTATELMRRDNARQVFLALRRLPTRYRTALTLREFHGMSSAEIAESMSVSLGAVDSMVSRARDAFGAAYAEAAGYPQACRENVERIYRDMGTGIDRVEKAQMEMHNTSCTRCRAEYKRAHSARYVRGLLPFLVAKMPNLNLIADAVVRSAEAPGVMQSFPAITATAVATISAAIVLSPVAAQRFESRAGTKAPTEISRLAETNHNAPAGFDAAETPLVVEESSVTVAAVATSTVEEAPSTVVAVAGNTGTETGTERSGSASGTPTGGHEGSRPSSPSAPPTDPGSADEPSDPPTPPVAEEPAPEPEQPPAAEEAGWAEVPADAEFQAPEDSGQPEN